MIFYSRVDSPTQVALTSGETIVITKTGTDIPAKFYERAVFVGAKPANPSGDATLSAAVERRRKAVYDAYFAGLNEPQAVATSHIYPNVSQNEIAKNVAEWLNSIVRRSGYVVTEAEVLAIANNTSTG